MGHLYDRAGMVTVYIVYNVLKLVSYLSTVLSVYFPVTELHL